MSQRLGDGKAEDKCICDSNNNASDGLGLAGLGLTRSGPAPRGLDEGEGVLAWVRVSVSLEALHGRSKIKDPQS